MNKTCHVNSTFLIPLAVFPLLKMIIKFCFALIPLALQNPTEDKTVIDFYAV